MNTAIQTNLVSPDQVSGLQDLTANMIGLFEGLVKLYIPGLPNFYIGVRPVEAEDVNIPCVMIQPVNVDPKMVTSQKYQKWYAFDFWYAVGGQDIDSTVIACTSVGEIFQKLFSNNALNDLGTATPTSKFKRYDTNWVDSEMSKVDYSTAFLSGRQQGPKYMAVGNFQLRVQTVKLV